MTGTISLYKIAPRPREMREPFPTRVRAHFARGAQRPDDVHAVGGRWTLRAAVAVPVFVVRWYAVLGLNFALFLLCLAAVPAAAQQPSGSIAGRVLFPDGTPVAGATVRIVAAGNTPVALTSDAVGKFARAGLPAGSYSVSAEQGGVEGHAETVQVAPGAEARVELLLSVARRREAITVTATLDPREAGSIPASVAVFDGDRLRNMPGATLDEALRAVPGFSLFRRTSSLAAHPTSQGVSLRGVGPSGASRSLVLADGFPVNDPFGGWVYWNRMPREALASVEVLRGAASSLYGNAALAGVVSMLSERPQRTAARASLAGGSTGLVDGSWLGAARSPGDRWGLALDGQAFRNDGYLAIGERERGPVDAPIALRYISARARIERRLHADGVAYASFAVLTEDRENGTRLLNNSTDLRYGTAGAEWRTGTGSRWRAGLFAQGETFRSTFSNVAAGRTRETLTLTQRVPSNAVTSRFDWSRGFAAHHVTAGGDLRWVDGDSYERSAARLLVPGGRQVMGGIFVQDVFAPADRWQVVASLRADRWTSRDRQTGQKTSATVFNPQLGLRFQATGRVALRAQAYRGFRGPTLNELYRQFQVGNAVTLANAGLRPERTNGAEAGIDLQAGTGLLRVTGFWTELREPVSNVTLSIGPTILRQRRNVGRARIRGIEADWEWRPRPLLGLRASYLFDDARVKRFAPDPRLEGRRIPQVPRHQGYSSVEFHTSGRGLLLLDARLSGLQFDDDRNLLSLAGFAEFGTSFTQPVGDHVEWFVRAQNLFARRYPVAHTPVEMLSAPRIAQVGVRVRWPRQ